MKTLKNYLQFGWMQEQPTLKREWTVATSYTNWWPVTDEEWDQLNYPGQFKK